MTFMVNWTLNIKIKQSVKSWPYTSVLLLLLLSLSLTELYRILSSYSQEGRIGCIPYASCPVIVKLKSVHVNLLCVLKKKKERWQSTLFQTPPSRPPHPNPRPTSGRKVSDQFTSRQLASSSGHDTVYTHNFNYLQLKKDKHILQKGKNIFHLRIF